MDIKEQLAKLLPNADLSQEFFDKLSEGIQLVIAKQVEEKTSKLQEEIDAYSEYAQNEYNKLSEKAEEYGQYTMKETIDKIDKYLEYITEQFFEEKISRLIETDEYNRMANAFRTIKETFERKLFPA